MDFDLPGMDTKTRSEEGVDMTVLHITTRQPMTGRDGKTVTIKLLGPDSVQYRKETRSAVRKRLRSAVSNEADPADTFDADEAESIDMLARCTLGWTGICTTKGEPIPCTPETAAALYTGFPAIRDQVDSFIAVRTNFIKA